MKEDVKKLIEKCEDKKKRIINPDDASWNDIGFDEKPDEWETVDDFLRAEGELDEYDQTQLQIIDELIEDLKCQV